MSEYDDYREWRNELAALLCNTGLPCASDLWALFDDGLTPALAAREVLDAEQAEEREWHDGDTEPCGIDF
jgi:hypothetical protein